ncbi:hypothetical protein D9615_010483 [Tricholomella constricta]|uniref:Uncharacterized protein n=1 Tax=Tricholomella constricta TaxID=117010 RepID=A0A8H5GMT3_9AGAR|nr:hypothetical protein D9615_010483 [Tricholomella constricta]
MQNAEIAGRRMQTAGRRTQDAQRSTQTTERRTQKHNADRETHNTETHNTARKNQPASTPTPPTSSRRRVPLRYAMLRACARGYQTRTRTWRDPIRCNICNRIESRIKSGSGRAAARQKSLKLKPNKSLNKSKKPAVRTRGESTPQTDSKTKTKEYDATKKARGRNPIEDARQSQTHRSAGDRTWARLQSRGWWSEAKPEESRPRTWFSVAVEWKYALYYMSKTRCWSAARRRDTRPKLKWQNALT